MALCTSEPACKDGTVDGGGCVRRLIMSDVACLRKSLIVTLGNLICFGRNTTVSVVISAQVDRT